MVEPGAAVADLIFHRHRQRIEAQVAVFTAQAGAGVMTQHLAAEQETAAEGRGVAAQHQVVMGEVVAERVLKRQLDMLEVRVIGHRHGQSPAGEVRLLIEAQVMFDHSRLRPAFQRQVMAIVGGIQRIAGQATGDMHQQQRFIQAAVARHANAGHRLGQAFGQMEKHLRLQGIRQMLALIIDTDLHAAGGKIVAQLRMIAAIDKHQPPGVQRQRQRITLFSAERCPLVGDKVTVQ